MATSTLKPPYGCCRLQTLINYALKAERDLWGLLDGPWDGPNYADHRRTWSTQACFLFLVNQWQGGTDALQAAKSSNALLYSTGQLMLSCMGAGMSRGLFSPSGRMATLQRLQSGVDRSGG